MFLETSRHPHHLLFVQDIGFPQILNILRIGYHFSLLFLFLKWWDIVFHLTVLFLYNFQKNPVASNTVLQILLCILVY